MGICNGKCHNYCTCCGEESSDKINEVIKNGKFQIETTDVSLSINSLNATLNKMIGDKEDTTSIEELKKQIDTLKSAVDKKNDASSVLKGASAIVNVIDPQAITVNANEKVAISTTGTFSLATANTTESITNVETVVTKDSDNHIQLKEFQPLKQTNIFSIGVDIAPIFGGAGTATVVFELYSLASASVVRSQVLTITSSFPVGYTSLPHTVQFSPISDENSFSKGYELRIISDSQIKCTLKKVVRSSVGQ